MAKGHGLGQALYLGGYSSQWAVDLSGDTGSIDTARGGPELEEVQGIDKLAKERIGLRRDGALDWTAFFNPASGQAHDFYSALPTGDIIALWLAGTGTLGDPVYALNGKTPDYALRRAPNGSIRAGVGILANAYGGEWCQLLHPKATDASAANGTSIDGTAATSFGASAYALVFSLGSGTVTPVIQDSADNSTFAAITGMTFSGVSAAATAAQRVQSSAAQSIRRYVRNASTGTFTDALWVGAFIRHQTATL